MGLNYPLQCQLCTPPVDLTDDAATVSHHTSEHSSLKITDFRAQLVAVQKQTPQPPKVRTRAHLSNLARFGLTAAALHDIKDSETGLSSVLGPKEVDLLAKHLEGVVGFAPSKDRLILDLFLFILEHGATDGVEDLGGLFIYKSDGSESEYMTWKTLKDEFTSCLRPHGIKFTFRRFVSGLDGVFAEMWDDPEIHALDEVRANGTARSRDFRLAGGAPCPAYVVVAGLFNNRLTQAEWDARKIYRVTANVNKPSTGGETEYTGLSGAVDADNEVDHQAARKMALRRAKLWEGAGGSPAAPKKTGVQEAEAWRSRLNALQSPYSEG